MENRWFTAPPPCKGRTALTIVSSVLLHLTAIAVAALWPVWKATSAVKPQITALADYQPDGVFLPSAPLPPEEAEAPPALASDAAADTPPAEEIPSMEIAAPKPAAKAVEARVRPVRSALPAGPVRSAQATQPGGVAVDGPGRSGAPGRWITPRPPYPYALRAARVAGDGSVRITTDASGRVTNASVLRSTGSALLDENTVQFARTNWSGPPSASTIVPITYQVR